MRAYVAADSMHKMEKQENSRRKGKIEIKSVENNN